VQKAEKRILLIPFSGNPRVCQHGYPQLLLKKKFNLYGFPEVREKVIHLLRKVMKI
jgi:hypothetical protein